MFCGVTVKRRRVVRDVYCSAVLSPFQIVDSSSLSWSTRVKGFAICFVLGFVFSLIGSIFMAFPGGLRMFGLFYTLGNLTAIASTLFLMGPLNQVKKMFAPTRAIATCVMLVRYTFPSRM